MSAYGTCTTPALPCLIDQWDDSTLTPPCLIDRRDDNTPALLVSLKSVATIYKMLSL